jgi:hypothetical protein
VVLIGMMIPSGPLVIPACSLASSRLPEQRSGSLSSTAPRLEPGIG